MLPTLIAEYHSTPVRHADETSWRTEGQSDSAWLFGTPPLSLFLFRATRAAVVHNEARAE